jgi:hypothetical protein
MNSSEIVLYVFLGIVLLYILRIINFSNVNGRTRKNLRRRVKRECLNCGKCPYGLKCGGKCNVCKHCPYGNSCPFRQKMIEGFADIPGNISNEMDRNCTVCKSDTDADTYLRNRLLVGRGECESERRYTKKELADYRDRHFAFRNKVWQTSKDVDMVDKINDMYLSGSYDLSRNKNGTRIADLFDGLTKNEDQIPQQCPMDYNGDKAIQRVMNDNPYVENGHNGKMIQNVNWKYSNEKDMNGGEFYNGITGYDGDFAPAQLVQNS